MASIYDIKKQADKAFLYPFTGAAQTAPTNTAPVVEKPITPVTTQIVAPPVTPTVTPTTIQRPMVTYTGSQVEVFKNGKSRMIDSAMVPSFEREGFTTTKPVTPVTPEIDTTTNPREDTPTEPTAPVIDEDALRRQEEERIAAQIKAIEGVYAGEIAKAKKAGEGRVQQRTAMSTVRGGAGSDFASAEKDVVEQANADIITAINQQMLAEIAAARSKGGENARAAIKAAYENAANKKALADSYIADQKTKFADAESKASKLSIAGTPYESLDEATRQLLEQYYGVEGAKNVYANYAKTSDKTFTTVSPGSSLYDSSGKLIGTAPSAPTDTTKPITQEVGNSLLQWDPTTNTWKNIYTSPDATDKKLVTINGKTYQQNADGTYSEPEIPTNVSNFKVEQFNLLDTAMAGAEKFANAAGRSKWKEAIAQGLFGATDYTNLQSYAQTLKTNLLTLATDPDVKKFFGPQMSNADVRMMMAGGTTLDPELQNPAEFRAELTRVKDLITRMKNSVTTGINSSTTRMTGPDGLIYDVPNDQVDAFIADGGKRFNQVDGDTNKAIEKTVAKASSVVDDTKGGQCGTFVRKVAGIRVGDSYQSKLAAMDPTITEPQPGMVFTIPYKDTGHIGIILDIKDGIATVKHSNYDLNEKVTTDQIPVSKMTGFTYPKIA